MNGWRGYVIKAAVSLGLLGYLVYRVGGIPALVAPLQEIPGWALALALGLYSLAVLVTAMKWWVLVRVQGLPASWRAILHHTLVAAFFNNVLPANVGGDVMRGYGLVRETGRAMEAVISVVMDRLVGLVAFISTAVVAGGIVLFALSRGTLQAAPGAYPNIARVTAFAGMAQAALLGVLAVLLSRRLKARGEQLLARVRWLRPLLPRFQQVALALNMYRHAGTALLVSAGLSGLALVLASSEAWVLARYLVPGGIPFLYVVLLNPLIAFALLIPFSIGGLGVGQTAFVFFFGLVGVPASSALVLSLVHQAIVYLASLPGAVLWWRARGAGVTVLPEELTVTPRA